MNRENYISAPPESRSQDWYGWKILVADLIAFVFSCVAMQVFLYLPMIALVLCGPILHWRAGFPRRGAWSLLRRLLMPVGFGVVFHFLFEKVLLQLLDNDFPVLVTFGSVMGAIAGALIGLIFCMVWDCLIAHSPKAAEDQPELYSPSTPSTTR